MRVSQITHIQWPSHLTSKLMNVQFKEKFFAAHYFHSLCQTKQKYTEFFQIIFEATGRNLKLQN